MDFKVGQRVRIVGTTAPWDRPYEGVETVVTGSPYLCDCGCGEMNYPVAATSRGVFEGALQPLTDPKAEAWAADAVRKVTKPEPSIAPPLERITRKDFV